jgi:amidase
LRIATSVVPARSLVPPIVDDVVRDAVSSAASALTALGHTVVERSPHFKRVGNDIPVLYTRGIRAHYETVPHPDRLEKRTRGVARYGRIIPDRLLRSALNRQAGHADRINAIFDDVDVLITPVTGTLPVRVGNWQGKGALRTVLGMGRVYPFTAVWNYTGQPAMAVPVGLGAQGLPLSVMLIAPPNREDRLLSLAYQMETANGWPANRPPVD